MDPPLQGDVMMQFWIDLFTAPEVLLGALFLGVCGEMVKRAVNAKKVEAEVVSYRDAANRTQVRKPEVWKVFYYTTLPAQSPIMGVIAGLFPFLPVAEGLIKEGQDPTLARVVTYAVAGVVCKIGYDTFIATARRTVRKKAREFEGSSDSTPSDPPSDPNASI